MAEELQLIGSEKTKHLFDNVSLKDSHGLLLSLLHTLEQDVLTRLRSCPTADLVELKAEAVVIHKMKMKLLEARRKTEKQENVLRTMPAGM